MKITHRSPKSKFFVDNITCGRCRYNIPEVKVWQIVFAHEKPDLVERAREGTINLVECARCHHSALVHLPFLYIDIEALRVVFVSSIGLSQIENEKSTAELFEIATKDLIAEEKSILMSRLQKIETVSDISKALQISSEEVKGYNEDLALYIEWEGLPVFEKIEKMVQAAQDRKSYIMSDAEFDYIFEYALISLIKDAEKNNLDDRLTILTHIFDQLQTGKKYEMEQIAVVSNPYDKSINLPEKGMTWDLERKASYVLNASDFYKSHSPEETEYLHNPNQNKEKPKKNNDEEKDVDYSTFSLNLRELARRNGDLEMEFFAVVGLGEQYLSDNLTSRALSCFERALRISEKLDDDKLRGMALGGLGKAYVERNQVEMGISNLQTAANYSLVSNDYKTYAVCLHNLARAKRSIGLYDSAKRFLEIALHVFHQIKDQSGRINEVLTCLYDLGPLCIELGDLDEAKTHLLEALDLCRQSENIQMEVRILIYLGACCLQMKEPIGADIRSYMINDGDGTGSLMIERVPTSEGIRYFEQALGIVTQASVRTEILSHLSAINLQAGYYHRSLRFYEEIFEILEDEENNTSIEPYHLANLSDIWLEKFNSHIDKGGHEEAKEAGQKAFEYSKNAVELSGKKFVAGETDSLPYIHKLAFCAELTGNYDEALQTYRYLAGMIEGLRVSFKDDKHKEFFHQNSILTFARAGRCALRLADITPDDKNSLINEAFHYIESAKCRFLFDMINDPPSPDEYRNEFFMSKMSEDLQDLVENVSERPVGFHPSGKSEIIKSLGNDTALLEYSMIQSFGEKTGFWALLGILPNKKNVRLLHKFDLEETYAAKEEFYKIAGNLEEEMDKSQNKHQVEEVLDKSRADYEEILTKLGKILLPQTVLEKLWSMSIRRLIIVPESYLFDIPWSILRVSMNGKEISLIGQSTTEEGFEIVIAPSASIYVQCHKKTEERKKLAKNNPLNVLLFGGAHIDSYSNFSDFVERKIKNEILDNHSNTKHYLGQSANHANFIENISSANVFFFYGHTNFNSDNPLESHLIFSSENNNEEDYLLSAHEIISFPKNNSWSSCALFIMASCNGQKTNYTNLWNSREILGLNTAVFQRGVSGIIGSLWKIRVATVCGFYPNFFDYYISGNSVSKSLRKAQIDLQNSNGLFSHPHLWGSIYIMGDYKA